MTREEIIDDIRRLMSSLFEIDGSTVTAESRLGDDLDLDSIDAIDLIIKMQDMTGQKVDPEAMKTLRTVGDIADMVEKLMAEGA
jgi:acyl carrier protein